MTEEQALKKRCCGPEGCGEIIYHGQTERYCIASGCMAWVEQPVYKDGEKLASITMGGRCGLVNK